MRIKSIARLSRPDKGVVLRYLARTSGYSRAAAAFTDRQARLFRWLFGQPDRSFYMNELMRLTSLSSASLQQELKRLTLAGLVHDARMGNLRVFKANPAAR